MDRVGFFENQTADFVIRKANFLENTLVYTNHGSVTPMKDKLAIYLDYVILEQLIPAMNTPDNIVEYESKPNEVKLTTARYNVDSGKILGLEKDLVFIMVRGDQDEAFFSDGFDKTKMKKLYSTSKKLLLNIFSGTLFKKYQNFLVKHRMRKEAFIFFFYLPSTTDLSHDINHFGENVSLHPIYCPYEDFRR